jgi:predicted PurR-regulated permease PerM
MSGCFCDPKSYRALNGRFEREPSMQESKRWSNTTRYFVLILVLGGLIWLAVSARDLIGPLAISALLAYVLNPLVLRLSKQSRLSRQSSVLLVFMVSIAALGIAGALIAPVIPAQISNLADQLETITVQVQTLLATPVTVLNVQIPLDVVLANWPAVTRDFTRPDLLISVVSATSQNLVWVLVVVFTTYYLLLDWSQLRDWLIGIVPDPYSPDVRHLYVDIRRVWNRYFAGQLRLMFIIGLVTGAASAAMGLPGALAFAVLAGLFDIFLSVGPLIVTVIAGIVAFVAGSTYLPLSNVWFMVLVVAVFSAIQLFENGWLRPRIMSERLHLHPAVVFVAVIASLAMAGILTALIIVPLIGSAIVVGRYLYCKILDIEPWPEKEEEKEHGELHQAGV